MRILNPDTPGPLALLLLPVTEKNTGCQRYCGCCIFFGNFGSSQCKYVPKTEWWDEMQDPCRPWHPIFHGAKTPWIAPQNALAGPLATWLPWLRLLELLPDGLVKGKTHRKAWVQAPPNSRGFLQFFPSSRRFENGHHGLRATCEFDSYSFQPQQSAQIWDMYHQKPRPNQKKNTCCNVPTLQRHFHTLTSKWLMEIISNTKHPNFCNWRSIFSTGSIFKPNISRF